MINEIIIEALENINTDFTMYYKLSPQSSFYFRSDICGCVLPIKPPWNIAVQMLRKTTMRRVERRNSFCHVSEFILDKANKNKSSHKWLNFYILILHILALTKFIYKFEKLGTKSYARNCIFQVFVLNQTKPGHDEDGNEECCHQS